MWIQILAIARIFDRNRKRFSASGSLMTAFWFPDRGVGPLRYPGRLEKDRLESESGFGPVLLRQCLNTDMKPLNVFLLLFILVLYKYRIRNRLVGRGG
jgi:hypothetical protein